MYLFEEGWYHGYINQALMNMPDSASADSIAIANGIMVAAAFIAQAIDGSFSNKSPYSGVEKNTTREAIADVAAAIERIADSMVKEPANR